MTIKIDNRIKEWKKRHNTSLLCQSEEKRTLNSYHIIVIVIILCIFLTTMLNRRPLIRFVVVTCYSALFKRGISEMQIVSQME